MNRSTSILLLIITYAIIISSCGARHVKKSESKEETKNELIDNSTIEKKSGTNVKTTITIKADDKNETVTEEMTISPEDNAKEAFIIEKDGTKTVLNNAKKTVKKTTQKNNTQTKKIGNSELVQNSVIKEQKSVKAVVVAKKQENSKQIDKKELSPFNLLWLLIPVLIIYVFYRIYKKLPLVPKF